MDDREDLVYQAKLAEQAERYDGELAGQRGAGILGPYAAAHRGREQETKWRHHLQAWPGDVDSGSRKWPLGSRSGRRLKAQEFDPFGVLSCRHSRAEETKAIGWRSWL